ncbi:MAG: hypothetical protein ACHRXM_14945 [Isosphaerales bacterium]
MADRVFFVASSPEEFIRGVSVPEEMLSDLLAISRHSVEEIEQISTALESATGFLDDAGLEAVIQQTVTSEDVADALKRAIRGLRPQAVDQTLTTLRTWRQADSRRAERFPDDSLHAIETILPRLIRPFPALERQRKARRLESLTGNQVRETEIVCDARPVFDSERSTVEGFVTQTILKIVFDSQQEESKSIELVLSQEQLEQLGDKVGKAKRKLEVLRTSIQTWILNGLAETVD